MLIECCWSKRRIMETYLNVIETGRNMYGVEAPAREVYGKSAKELNCYEASMIATVLPNPLRMRLQNPSNYMVLPRRPRAYPDEHGRRGRSGPVSRAGFYRPPIKFFSSLLLPENFSVDSSVFLLASNASSRIMFSKPAELRPADRRSVEQARLRFSTLISVTSRPE